MAPDRNGQQRGGKRVGSAGRNYANRSDLRSGPRKPSTPQVAPASTNPQYGAQAAQLRSLQALPLAPASPSPPQVAPANGTGAAPPSPIIPLDAPTMRPDEPLTAGVDVGPGPGAPQPLQPSTINDLLRVVAPTSPELAQLYEYLTAGGR